MSIARIEVSTALGTFVVEASLRGVRRVAPGAAGRPEASGASAALAHAEAAGEALRRYAAGDRARFDGPFDFEAAAFHRAVWERLRAIPFGATTTYGKIAAALGLPGEARAVGAAVGSNPIAVLVPCHRVVGADGSLRGFAWGPGLKRRLLAHEGSAVIDLFV